VRTQAALRQLQTLATPGHRIVVSDHALLNHAQDVIPWIREIEEEGRG
jgi:hypothetical protein